MPERKGQEPNFLEKLGGGRWFRYGRRFGLQTGSLEQKLEDPYTRCSDIVRRYWGGFVAYDIPSWQLDNVISLLTGRVNDGTADEKLIPSIEAIVMRSTPYPFTDQLSDYQRFKEDSQSIFHLYHRIISSGRTAESIPYLLQAANSSFVVRGNEPIKTDPPLFHHAEEEYDVYRIVQHWDARYPFAEEARVRVREINARTPDPQSSKEIEEAIARFDAMRVREVTTTAQTRRRHTIVSPLSPT